MCANSLSPFTPINFYFVISFPRRLSIKYSLIYFCSVALPRPKNMDIYDLLCVLSTILHEEAKVKKK